ncbi:siderophore-interacting protein [Streptomyces armeniacus]|uniref:Siderophore-interacting protein n=1 Tax=Streptomyces armeniacus TaxID=83291 RepID=A0A345XW27_9ACTN|nr:siderophore-interacting protein [Streptomyces armeniacus]AXK35843.1 siderophore-interacting protein [Streptomyces armeniacus]
MSTAAPEAPTLPFEFFELRVVRARRVTPSMMRITLGGGTLKDLVSGGRDQRLKLFLPQPGQEAPVVPVGSGESWFPEWQAMDPDVRGIMRTYTVREQRRTADELDIDFALHGAPGSVGDAGGPAARWAAAARPGDRVTVLGPLVPDNAAVDFRPPPATDWMLISGDETALPAVAGILDWLPAGTKARVWLEVPHAEDVQTLPTAADAEITWLVRDDAPAGASRTDVALAALRTAELPSGTPYAWIAGEAGTVKALRRHLVGERGFDRKAVKFTGYWRLGSTEEQLVAEALAGNPVNAED